MESQGLSTNELRIIVAVIGAIIFGLIYLFGRPRKPGQGRRTLFQRGGSERVEGGARHPSGHGPSLGAAR